MQHLTMYICIHAYVFAYMYGGGGDDGLQGGGGRMDSAAALAAGLQELKKFETDVWCNALNRLRLGAKSVGNLLKEAGDLRFISTG